MDDINEKLFEACKDGDLNEVQRILNSVNSKEIIDINIKNDFGGNTPLHYAALLKEKDITELLISYGADVNLKNNEGSMPLHWSAKHGNNAVYQFLISKGADANAKNKANETPQYLSVKREICDRLYDKIIGCVKNQALGQVDDDKYESEVNNERERSLEFFTLNERDVGEVDEIAKDILTQYLAIYAT